MNAIPVDAPAAAPQSASAFSKWEQGLALLADVEEDDIDIALTPKDVVFQRDSMTLYRYRPLVETPLRTPLLITYAMFGRYTMIDLEEQRSMVQKLLSRGLDVYVIDWGMPKRAARWLDTNDFVNGYLDECVDIVRARSHVESIHLLGICQGGVFSLCHAALHPHKIKGLVLIVTPVDFHADLDQPQTATGYMNRWARAARDEDIDLFTEAWGLVPKSVVATTFMMMSPVEHAFKYGPALAAIVDDADKLKSYLRMERWIADRPECPGELMREWLRDFYKHNLLVKNEIVLGGRRVDLGNVNAPILNVFAAADAIVPPSCSRGLAGRTGSSDYRELVVPGGHIGAFVGSRAQALLGPTIADWVQVRSSAPSR